MFPEGFLWGATTSAHAVEGADFDSDWWYWEQRPGRIADNATSKTAADHRNRYAADYDLARKLGHTAHLLALSWARIQPKGDAVDAAGLDHYRQRIEGLRARSIEPIIALMHNATPKWFADGGGWSRRDAPERFADYARAVAQAIGDRCRRWIPFLDPVAYHDAAYLEGRWPPERRGGLHSLMAARNLLDAHGRAYGAIHDAIPDAQVGGSFATAWADPLDEESPWDVRTARREQRRQLETPLMLLSGDHRRRLPGLEFLSGDRLDFIAVTDGGRYTTQFAMRRARQLGARITDGPHHDPAALLARLGALHAYGKPILLVGSRLTPADDAVRCHQLLDHAAVVEAALAEGIPVIGYLHRAFLDGFEWRDGYTIRRGLVHVDWETLARTPNPSAYLLKDLIEAGHIRNGAITRFCPGWTRPNLELTHAPPIA